MNNTKKQTKNVSWTTVHDSPNYDKKREEEKKRQPSTPYPRKTKKLKISANSTPNSLLFYDSADEEDISFTPESHNNKKRKRFKKQPSNWIVTNSEVKPDKTNKSADTIKRIVNTRNGSYEFDEDTFASKQIADKIFKNMIQDELESLSGSDSNESPDELIPIKSDDEESDSHTIIFDSSSDESDFNLNVLFDPPEIKLDTKACQIIEPKIPLKPKLKPKTSEPPKAKTREPLKPKIREPVKPKISEPVKPKISEPVKPKISEPVKPTKKINILDKVEYYFGETHSIIILKHPFKLYFNGKLSVIILSGKLEILGHSLEYKNDEQEFEVYNPRGHSYLCLETLESHKNPNISNILDKYLQTETASNISINDNDCIVAVRNLQNKMSEYLLKHIAQHLYPNRFQYDSKRPLMELENELNCLFSTEQAALKLYNKHESWPKVVQDSLLTLKDKRSCITVLAGGKNVGKSTLMRYMINNMLNEVREVVCIDLDPGQSEFTIGGCVSVTLVDAPIFGPNYTHLKQPKKSFFIGDVNVSAVLDRYISCIIQLLNYCEQNISKETPWIVNCMGFSKSIGTDIIVLILKLLKPNIVVQLESAKRSNNFSAHLTPEFVDNFAPSFPLEIPNNKSTYNLEIIQSVAENLASGEWVSEPRLLREMCILAYFSQMLQDKNEITGVVPYGVKLSSIQLHNVNYSREHILATINGNLVALCETNGQVEPETPLPCRGFGIVRGIDKQSDELYLLTPVEDLEDVNTVVRGNIALPPSIFMTTGHQGLVPYIQLGTLQGTSAIPKRSFISWKVLLNKK